MIVRCLLLFPAFAFCCATQFADAGDDPDVYIFSKASAKVKWVWSIKRSRLATLPEWDPTKSEPPVTPHQAVMIGRQFVHERLGVDDPLMTSIILAQIGIEPNPVKADIWAYTLVFDSEKPSEDDQALLHVVISMDGQVIVPVKQPVK